MHSMRAPYVCLEPLLVRKREMEMRMIAKFDSALVPYVIEQTPRGERRKRRVPSCCSSCLTLWLTADCER